VIRRTVGVRLAFGAALEPPVVTTRRFAFTRFPSRRP
jgi:hypothetical protein